MQIRARTDDDLPALIAMAERTFEREGYPRDCPDRRVARWLAAPVALAAWVAELDDAVIAHIALHAEATSSVMEVAAEHYPGQAIGSVGQLLLPTGHRRAGIGTTLLERARQEASRLGRVPLLGTTDDSSATVALYRAAGWRPIGRATAEPTLGNVVTTLVFSGLLH